MMWFICDGLETDWKTCYLLFKELRKGHFLSFIYQKRHKNKKSEKKLKQRNISFKRLIVSFVQLTDLV